MIIFDTSNTKADLQGILALQSQNLTNSLTPEDLTTQGFVTVHHTLEQLQKLNEEERHIVAKDNGKIVGYVLAMTQKSKADIPVLVPMFEVFDEIAWKGKMISSYNYMVVGQVCVDKGYRGQGIFDRCYEAYSERYRNQYDFAITEIATANTRSLQAHHRIGFRVVKTYTSPDKVEWAIVVWEW
ncbi:GNAT family N-acetyltransferase [Eisenibacter elegans]|jgi:L-amino acid N-acyltransferase YncA|uniref:GNAT family N-acetyltransferase n=1 Tax=Eisenibacter elegans TaxID=997 RepID=UPI0004211100|nr:GNAT family N-acetyltransferase [Eisenibacter elegans]